MPSTPPPEYEPYQPTYGVFRQNGRSSPSVNAIPAEKKRNAKSVWIMIASFLVLMAILYNQFADHRPFDERERAKLELEKMRIEMDERRWKHEAKQRAEERAQMEFENEKMEFEHRQHEEEEDRIALEKHSIELERAKQEKESVKMELEKQRVDLERAKQEEEKTKIGLERDQYKLEREREERIRERDRFNDEQRRREEDEERRRIRDHGSYWDLPTPERCIAYGVREYRSHLHNIPTYSNHIRWCSLSSITIHNKEYMSPNMCGKDQNGVFGFWIVNSEEYQCQSGYWEPFKKLECTGPNSGQRRVEARIWGLIRGDDWIGICRTTPAVIEGVAYPTPLACMDENEQKNGVVGVWEIEDQQCA